jgi:hypothetical protein
LIQEPFTTLMDRILPPPNGGGTVGGGHHLNATPLQIDAAAGHQVGRGDPVRGKVIGEFTLRD